MKEKKSFYKRWYFWLALVLMIGILGNLGNDTPKDEPNQKPVATEVNDKKEKPAETPKEKPAEAPKEKPAEPAKEKPVEKPKVSKEFENALKKAKIYSDQMYMSKQGIYEQLISEYGEGFPEDAAQYAIDNLDADYKYNALQKAKSYQDTMSMSHNAVYEQLISEYGEGFTEEEAQYAVDNLE